MEWPLTCDTYLWRQCICTGDTVATQVNNSFVYLIAAHRFLIATELQILAQDSYLANVAVWRKKKLSHQSCIFSFSERNKLKIPFALRDQRQDAESLEGFRYITEGQVPLRCSFFWASLVFLSEKQHEADFPSCLTTEAL